MEQLSPETFGFDEAEKHFEGLVKNTSFEAQTATGEIKADANNPELIPVYIRIGDAVFPAMSFDDRVDQPKLEGVDIQMVWNDSWASDTKLQANYQHVQFVIGETGVDIAPKILYSAYVKRSQLPELEKAFKAK